MKTNPFIFSKLVYGDNFCHRDEVEIIKTHIINSQNIVLFSKRRYGKSSLIKEIFENHLDKKEFITIYTDIFSINSANDFAYILYKNIAKSLKISVNKILNTLKDIFTRASFSANVTKDGELEFRPTLISKDFRENIEDIFVNLDKYAKKEKKKIVIAIDEFQQISLIKDTNIEAILRTQIQNLENISFIFCGSKQHLLTQMFISHAKPFYKQAELIELKSIKQDDFFEFVKAKFENSKKTITQSAFEVIYEIAKGESWLIQNICYHLWQKYTQITPNEVGEIVDEIIDFNDNLYRMLFDKFSSTQKTALKIIATSQNQKILSQENTTNFAISKQSLVSAIKSLLEQEIISKTENSYEINDILFEIWVKEL